MPSFSGRVVIQIKNEEEYEKLKKEYGPNLTLMATWSYNGELVHAKDYDDIEKLNQDEDYAHERLMNSNLRV